MGMATDPNLPRKLHLVDTGPRRQRRSFRRYFIGALIIATLVVLFLVLWFLRFANTGPAQRPGNPQQAPAGVLLPASGSMAT